MRCPECGSERCYAFTARPGIDRDWTRDHPGYICTDCGARGTRLRVAA